MAYSDQQISQLASQLGSKGASPEDIESFVQNAKAQQGQAVTAAAAHPAVPPVDKPTPIPSFSTDGTGTRVVKVAGEGAATMMGATTGAEIGTALGPLGTLAGAGMGAAIGYGGSKLAEWMGGIGKPATPGELAQQAVLGPMAEASQAPNYLMRGLTMAGKAGLQYAASDAAKQALDDGQVDSVKALTQGAIAAVPAGVIGSMVRGLAPEVAPAMRGKVAAAQMGADQLGTVVSPSAAGNTNPLVKTLEKFAQPVELERQASAMNVGKVDNVIHGILELPNGSPITKDAIADFKQGVWDTSYKPVVANGLALTDSQYFQDLDKIANRYQGPAGSFPNTPDNGVGQIISGLKYKVMPSQANPAGSPLLSFDTGDALQKAQQLRDASRDAFAAGNATVGTAGRQASKVLEDQVERDLISKGAPGQKMLASFQQGRKQMAQAHLIESSLHWGPDEAGGILIPGKIGSVFQRQDGQGLSDGLDAIGAMASNQKDFMQNPATMKAVGRGWLDSAIGTAAMVGGAAHGETIPGLIGGALAYSALPAARTATRNLLLSQAAQKYLAKPAGASGFLPSSLAEQGIRAALMSKAMNDSTPSSDRVSTYNQLGSNTAQPAQLAPAQ